MIIPQKRIDIGSSLLHNFKHIPLYFLQPVRLFKSYDRVNLRPDLLAGLTLAIILLPQSIAFALVAELPPQMGLYTAIVGAAVAGPDEAQAVPVEAITDRAVEHVHGGERRDFDPVLFIDHATVLLVVELMCDKSAAGVGQDA